MGFRVRRRVKIAPGVWLNVGKRGTSVSVGGHGVTENFSKRGRRTTYSVRGTGVSYTTKARKASACGCVLPIIAAVAAGLTLCGVVLVRRHGE